MAAIFEELAVSAQGALQRDSESSSLSTGINAEASQASSAASTRSPQESMRRYFELARSAGKELEKLGVRGDDLGAVTRGELIRLDGLLKEEQFDRVRLVALHIAARLARATASFGAKGSPGVESSGGSGGGEPADSSSPPQAGKGAAGESTAESAKSDFDQLMDELSDLSKEHESQLEEMDRLIEQALQALKKDQQTPEAKAVADKLRRSARSLPTHGARPGGLRSEAALLRNRAEAMADALDRGDSADAIKEAQNAEQALKRARRQAEHDYSVPSEALEAVADALEAAVGFARKQAQQVGNEQLVEQSQQRQERASKERAIADALSELGKRAQAEGTPLPQGDKEAIAQAERNMRAAAESLEQGDVQRSIDLAKEAQRKLDQVAPADKPESERGGSKGEGVSDKKDEIVPDKDEVDPQAIFRQRVNEGLSKGSGRWEAIVRRYAQEIQ